MKNSKYLSSGENLGGHYEIVEVLGEDDFEILYLVKDRHLKDRLFVLKELFLNALSIRDEDNLVYTPAKSKYIFEQTKKEVILETNRLEEASQKQEIETYGYFEENNTVYIIMEFKNDSNLDNYLQVKFQKEDDIKDERELISASKDIKNKDIKKDSKKFPPFLIGLIFLLSIFMGLAYYAFTLIEDDKSKLQDKPSTTTVEVLPHKPKPMNHPVLTTRDNSTKEQPVKVVKNETNQTHEEVFVDNGTVAYIPPNSEVYIEENITSLEGVPKAEIYVEDLQPQVEFQEENNFDQKSIGMFLGKFVESLSIGSIDDILSFYDSRVQKYFKSTRVTHQDIRKDRERYNRKWEYRDFRIISFSISKIYTEYGVEYCDLSVHSKWSVSDSNLKSDLGTNLGSITLKKTPNGFKIKSIY